MKVKRLAWLPALGLCVSMAQEPQKNQESKEAKQGPAPSGMVTVRTPDGGLRAPTPEEYRQLTGQGAASLRIGSPESQQVVIQGGRGVMVRLDPATTSIYSLAKKGPDGKLIVKDATGEKAADRMVKMATPVEKKEAAQ